MKIDGGRQTDRQTDKVTCKGAPFLDGNSWKIDIFREAKTSEQIISS